MRSNVKRLYSGHFNLNDKQRWNQHKLIRITRDFPFIWIIVTYITFHLIPFPNHMQLCHIQLVSR